MCPPDMNREQSSHLHAEQLKSFRKSIETNYRALQKDRFKFEDTLGDIILSKSQLSQIYRNVLTSEFLYCNAYPGQMIKITSFSTYSGNKLDAQVYVVRNAEGN